MGFIESIQVCFSKFFDYNGRAIRSEYWYFFLFLTIVNVVATIVEEILLFNTYMYEYGPISNTVSLILIIPGINACTRRLHDVGRSGWWQLLYLTGIGSLVILYWNIQKGTEETNKFG